MTRAATRNAGGGVEFGGYSTNAGHACNSCCGRYKENARRESQTRKRTPTDPEAVEGSSPWSGSSENHTSFCCRQHERTLPPGRRAVPSWANTRSTRVALYFLRRFYGRCELNSSPRYHRPFQTVAISSRLTKRVIAMSTPTRSVNTVFAAVVVRALSTHKPPTSTVISGAVSVSCCALSISRFQEPL